MTIYTMHNTDAGNLVDVVRKMETRGAPTIKAVFDGEAYYALEGSHRIAAAKILGLIPIIAKMEPEELVYNEDVDAEGLEPDTYCTAQDIFDGTYGKSMAEATQYFF